MYNDSREGSNPNQIKVKVLYVKICIAICVLILGAYVTIWSIQTVDQLINNTENTSIFKTIADLTSKQESFNVAFNDKRLVVENNDAFRIFFFLLTFIVLFNVIGRAITGIFKCLASIIGSLSGNPFKAANGSVNKRTE